VIVEVMVAVGLRVKSHGRFLLERNPAAWVLLACHHWVACCPSLDWGQRLHSEKTQKKQNLLSVFMLNVATPCFRIKVLE